MDKSTNEKFKAFTNKFFATKNITDSYKDVQWGSTESQKIRFQYICKLFEKDQSNDITLLDVGCGLGHLYDFILEKNYNNIRYSGLDIQKDFIEFAKKKHPEGNFMNKSLFELDADKHYDYLVASGTFSVTVPNENMKIFLEESVEKMFALCNKGIAFNLLTTRMPSEYIGTTETHFNPVEILDMCFKLTNRINLYHSYKPNDFTILMYK
ncbi:class I SAM-dependent methyltransferase [Heyndrickxia camelliae]|uniref:Methyltransferase type 12 domain-containing protein n=1 Tax=Heyndrickxia camelliae TaxID=1707093 RepID=A0A2N3LJB7_9BACI|nr:class I SAM-dependent methyltransferase [Heyndrickxia camelliae]PKR84633.1 hypothetical protein CWO92_13050 [Heyndrickxia camelliae]